MKIEKSIVDGININNVIYETNDFRNTQEKQAILNICYDCKSYGNNTCKECSCILDNLIGSKENKCPLNKW